MNGAVKYMAVESDFEYNSVMYSTNQDKTLIIFKMPLVYCKFYYVHISITLLGDD